jgi:hypothetical protein
MIIAVADLAYCVKIQADLPGCGLNEVYQRGSWELPFGDYTTGRFAWKINSVVKLDSPVPAKGALGLWTPPPLVVEQVMAQLSDSLRDRLHIMMER